MICFRQASGLRSLRFSTPRLEGYSPANRSSAAQRGSGRVKTPCVLLFAGSTLGSDGLKDSQAGEVP
jgi:hypothetical protein